MKTVICCHSIVSFQNFPLQGNLGNPIPPAISLGGIKISAFIFFLGQVVIAAGGFLDTGTVISQVELYSPDGKCQHVLTPLPAPVYGAFLVLFNASIVACSGSQNKECYKKNINKKIAR